jgi:MOSC domain-containing protein YiiM
MPKILSISVGKVQNLIPVDSAETTKILSAIHKTPLSDLTQPVPLRVERLGVVGDEQANLQVHGGVDKAVYVYPVEHYEFWKNTLISHRHLDENTQLPQGHFGENLTVEGLLEENVFLGDSWHVGSVIFQVSQLREPCFKFNIKMKFKGAAKAMVQTGYSGWYLRVLEAGVIQAGDTIRVEPGTRQTSIADQNRILYRLKGQSDLEF